MKEIIEEINRELARAFEPLLTAELLGLVETVRMGADKAFPAVIDERGEARAAFMDDRVALSSYHRLNSKTYNTSTASGYGDRRALSDCCEMSLVLEGSRRELDARRAVRLAEQAIIAVGDKRFSATPVSAVFDAGRVWQQEFRGVEFALPADRWLVSINYRIHHINTYC